MREKAHEVISAMSKISGNPLFKLSKLDAVVIAIGASTGGTEATLRVIKDLPVETPGIVVVQHMPEGFTTMYAERLNRICAMEVKEAEHGDEIRRGRVLIARGDFHMEVAGFRGGYRVELKKGEKVSGHRPSVDVLFDSVARLVKKDAVGIILTGMGKDGADGLLKMRQSGAFTIGQDEASSVVYGMPMVAFQNGAVCKQTSGENIAYVLKEYLSKL
ncbi:MAG: CheB methylesterase domain-containing protein [Proteocatella sp.]